MTKYLANSFSLGMLTGNCILGVTEVGTEEIKKNISDIVSIIGHQGTADFLSQLLNHEIKMNRVQISIKSGDVVYVLQLLTRLEEGKVLGIEELRNIKYKIYKVEVI
ncbi:MAG: DUF1874 domain-containing protein [Candidatus Aenigmatarchaeota archaeon]